MAKTTKEYWESLLLQHGSAMAISQATEWKYQAVYWNCKKHGLTVSKKAERRQRAASLNRQEVIEAYKDLKSSLKVGEKFGVGQDAILSIIPQELVEVNRCDRYECNEDVFNVDTERSFYWAGFLAADGCLMLKDGKYKQVTLNLSIKDMDSLKAFVKDTQFRGPIQDKLVKARKKEWNDSKQGSVTISSDRLFDSLSRFGLHPRKTFTHRFPEWLAKHDLVHHFMRGYFDGDGSVFWTKPKNGRKYRQLFFNVRGTPEFLLTFRQILEAHTTVRPRGNKPIRMNNNMGTLEYGGNRSLVSIRDFLYKDATRYLQRKYDKFFHEDVRENPRQGNLDNLRKASEGRKRPVVGVSRSGAKTRYESISDTERDGFSRSCVQDCLLGRQKSHRGCKFEYAS